MPGLIQLQVQLACGGCPPLSRKCTSCGEEHTAARTRVAAGRAAAMASKFFGDDSTRMPCGRIQRYLALVHATCLPRNSMSSAHHTCQPAPSSNSRVLLNVHPL